MKNILKILLLMSCMIHMWTVSVFAQQNQDTLTQLSTIDALMNGLYEGFMPVSEALKYGNAGIGTFEGLDGEMIALDGKIYQVPIDGVPKVAEPNQLIPFMAMTYFESDQEQPIRAGTEMKVFMEDAIAKLPTKNTFYAVRIEGTFQKVKTRSVPKQTPPYPPLTEVVKRQAVFELEHVEGTMIGFWCPVYVKGINVPGFHLHFLTKDGKAGGHVLDFTAQNAIAKFDITNSFFLVLPESRAFNQMDFTADHSADTHNVMKGKK